MVSSAQRVVVTGGASGIGAATARRFAADGARVAVLDLDEDGAARVAAALPATGGPSIAVRCDVGDDASVQDAVAAAVAGLGGVDVVVSNAGVGAMGTLDTVTTADWDRVVRVNLTGAFLVAKHALPVLRASGGGSLLFTSSAGGTVGTSASFAYNATKAAVNNMVRSLALDLAPEGIRVNCVCPGPVATPSLEANARAAGVSPDQLAALTVPMGRVGRPEEVADVFAWLASGAASYVTGQALVVDGAMTSGLFLRPPA